MTHDEHCGILKRKRPDKIKTDTPKKRVGLLVTTIRFCWYTMELQLAAGDVER